ncbi:MAG: ABC transporter permease [Opitutae bacterium]|nr:ABC transporter permease [Opitutae bacterium]
MISDLRLALRSLLSAPMLHDLRRALRSLRKTPGFTAIALLTLALGIGLNTSMFSVLNTLFLRTLPYADPDGLVRVYRTGLRGQTQLPHAPANFADLRAQSRSLTHLAALTVTRYNFAPPGQPALLLRGMNVTADFFPVLGISPALGRVFGAEEDQPGRDRVIVLSHSCWLTRFGADPAIVGRDLRLDGENVTVLGVMPPRFDDARLWGPVDAWRPMAFSAENLQNRGGNFLTVIGRRKPGVTLNAAQAELSAISARLAIAYPATNALTGINLMPLARSGEDPTIRTLTWFTLGLAGCVLLIACANLANLQFARNLLRARENAVRAALGATRLQLIRHSLAESLVLALCGGGLGLLLTLWTNDALGSRLQLNGRASLEIPPDFRVLGFAFALTAFTGLAFGLLPAWLAARVDVSDALKQGTRGGTGGRAQDGIRRTLIVAEFALALVLLSGAGFFIRGLERFATRDLGWRAEQALTASLNLPARKYGTDDAQRAFYDRLETRLGALPGVERVALATSLPFSGYTWSQRFVVEGRADPAPGAEPLRAVNVVSVGFFETLGLGLVEGRTFAPSDATNSDARTVINETMAKEYWPGESAVGKRIAHPSNRAAWQEIIGVVRDVRFATNVSEARPRLQTYRMITREPDSRVSIIVRSALPPEALADALRRAVAEIDPDLPVQDIRPALQTIESGLANFAALGALLAGFALLGLLLAALGIYGVIAGFVAQRTREIGVRLALGAQVRDVLRLVLRQGFTLALIGTGLGLFGVFAVGRLLASMLPALPAPEPATAASVIVLLLATALLACWLPARRASKVDPMVALRSE